MFLFTMGPNVWATEGTSKPVYVPTAAAIDSFKRAKVELIGGDNNALWDMLARPHVGSRDGDLPLRGTAPVFLGRMDNADRYQAHIDEANRRAR